MEGGIKIPQMMDALVIIWIEMAINLDKEVEIRNKWIYGRWKYNSWDDVCKIHVYIKCDY